MGNISKITTKFSGLSVWIMSVSLSGFECIAPFVERIADLSVQKARTEAVRRGEKIQFDGFYLTCSHYCFGATFHNANTSKIIAYSHRPTNVNCLSSQAAENSVITSSAAKKQLFSSRNNCNCWILKQFERTSYFLEIQAWVSRQNGKQKKLCTKEWSKRHIFLSHIFIFRHKPKRMLKFLRNRF